MMKDILNRLIIAIGFIFMSSFLLAQSVDTAYYDNGVISELGSYDSRGREKGHWVYFWENGNKQREGNLSKGRYEGEWMFYSEDGTLAEIAQYKKDVVLESRSPDGKKITLTRIDKMPEFPGGLDSLMKFLGSSIHYPSDAKDAGIEGMVYVTFIVGVDGEISNIKIVNSVYPSIDREVLRVVSTMPKWKPGVSYGRKVKVQYNLPVNFRLTK